MNIRTAFKTLLDEYPTARKQTYSGHTLANFIRHDIPSYLDVLIGPSDRYFAHGSAGQGQWARVPWIAIFDRLITSTAQDGYYIVFLIKEDYSGMYITLNQGVTTICNVYGSDSKEALSARASDLLARLGKVSDDCITGRIDLSVNNSSSLGSLYEYGNILCKYYTNDNIPTEKALETDLHEFLGYYHLLSSKDLLSTVTTTEEDDEHGLSQEDLTKLREHKRIERNKKLAEKVKKIHGYKCQACGFDFETRYGEIGKGFIEAHHLTPLSELKGQKIKLNPKQNFAVLCSNCHRMIHRTELVSRVAEFRKQHINN